MYPVYRKYKGIEVWFKILSDAEFIEVKKMGNRIICDRIAAIQYPEKLRIQDMISCYEERWESVDANQVELLLASCQK